MGVDAEIESSVHWLESLGGSAIIVQHTVIGKHHVRDVHVSCMYILHQQCVSEHSVSLPKAKQLGIVADEDLTG